MTKTLRALFLLALLLSFSGCLYTSQHFNTGKILLPGETVNSYGMTRGPLYTCDGDTKKDKNGYSHCIPEDQSYDDYYFYSESNVPAFSTGWRLGVREKWGPITGVDFGYHIEFPGTLDFDVRLGLPHRWGAKFFHNISAGWGLGAWADNNWFAEYALGFQAFDNYLFYGNFRETWLSTQLIDLVLTTDDTGNVFKHTRSFMHQLNLGVRINYAAITSWFPTYLHVNVNYTYPNLMLLGVRFPTDQSIDASKVNSRINLGLEWKR